MTLMALPRLIWYPTVIPLASSCGADRTRVHTPRCSTVQPSFRIMADNEHIMCLSRANLCLATVGCTSAIELQVWTNNRSVPASRDASLHGATCTAATGMTRAFALLPYRVFAFYGSF